MGENSQVENATGLKQLIQSMAPEGTALVLGIVVQTAPLTIQIVNNAKMVVSGKNLIVPRHLTNYQTKITIPTIAEPSLLGKTHLANEHEHTNPEGGETGKASEHQHTLEEFGISSATAIIHNALCVGERVNLLRFESGKQYYILDREVV